MKPWLRRVGGVLLVAALVQAAVAVYPLAKGALAMQLIARSYARAPGARPWSGADFRVVARLEAPRLRVEQHLLDSMSARALAFGPGLAPSAPGQGLIASAPISHSISVWLSVACATMAAPTLPFAPGLLSTTTDWPSASPSCLLIRRAMMSGAPAGAKPTTTRTGRTG